MFYIDIAVTQNRFICRKGRPEGKIKIIKFKNLKDIKTEMITNDYYKKVKIVQLKSKEKDLYQPIVDIIDKSDETITEIITSYCERF